MFGMTRRMSQLLGFLVLASMIFVLLSLGSYSAEDPTWNYYTDRESAGFANYGGRVGAFVADWGLQLFGTTVFLFVGCAAIGAVCLLRARVRPILTATWRSLLLIGAAGILAHLYWLDDPYFEADLLAGGASGQWLAEFLLGYLEYAGTYAVAGVVVLWVVFSCVGKSALDGVRRALVLAGLENEGDEPDDMDLYDEEAGPAPSARSFRRRTDRVASPDEPEFATAPRPARSHTPQPAEADAAENRQPAVPEAPAPEAPAPEVHRQPSRKARSFLARRDRRPHEPVEEPSDVTVPEKPLPASPPSPERSVPRVNRGDASAGPRTPTEPRPASTIPVVPSFRAKYVMDLQKSLRNRARETEAGPEDWEEETPPTREQEAPQVELPADDPSGVEADADLTDFAAQAEPVSSRPPSWQALRSAEPPRIVEAPAADATFEDDGDGGGGSPSARTPGAPRQRRAAEYQDTGAPRPGCGAGPRPATAGRSVRRPFRAASAALAGTA